MLVSVFIFFKRVHIKVTYSILYVYYNSITVTKEKLSLSQDEQQLYFRHAISLLKIPHWPFFYIFESLNCKLLPLQYYQELKCLLVDIYYNMIVKPTVSVRIICA